MAGILADKITQTAVWSSYFGGNTVQNYNLKTNIWKLVGIQRVHCAYIRQDWVHTHTHTHTDRQTDKSENSVSSLRLLGGYNKKRFSSYS